MRNKLKKFFKNTKYPETLATTIYVLFFSILLVLMILWTPLIWIWLGLVVIFLLVSAYRSDKRTQRSKDDL